MSDAIAIYIFIMILIAAGLGPACDFKGPGIAYKVDGVTHHFKWAEK